MPCVNGSDDRQERLLLPNHTLSLNICNSRPKWCPDLDCPTGARPSVIPHRRRNCRMPTSRNRSWSTSTMAAAGERLSCRTSGQLLAARDPVGTAGRMPYLAHRKHIQATRRRQATDTPRTIIKIQLPLRSILSIDATTSGICMFQCSLTSSRRILLHLLLVRRGTSPLLRKRCRLRFTGQPSFLLDRLAQVSNGTRFNNLKELKQSLQVQRMYDGEMVM